MVIPLGLCAREGYLLSSVNGLEDERKVNWDATFFE